MAGSITATFMFTDLVDSTALMTRLGPDGAERLRLAHFGVLRTAAEATGGIEVKSTGDGLMLMFTGPSRALSCAVAIQQGIRRHNQRATEQLVVRIGISMGEAAEEDGDYYGDCVVEAARLCAAAEGGQILTTDLLRAMVGRHATNDFLPVGDLDLKGIPDPVPAVEVAWSAEVAAGAIPVPQRLVGPATEGLFGFFGRTEELNAILAAAKRACVDARTEVVLLAGEPGIGKTTLAAQASRALHADGATVLFGHCAEGLVVPYQPWVEALSHLVEHAPDDLVADHVARHGAVLARLVPALGRRVPGLAAAPGDDLDGERFAVLEAVTGLLGAAATDAAVVVVLDDLQWADVASLQLMRHVLTASPSPPVLLLGTYRDSDLSRDHQLTGFLADLRREPTVARLALRGLDDRELLELMEGIAGHEMNEDGVALAHALYQETSGNPFFTGELLRHLYETGAIAFGEDGRYVLTVDLEDVGLPGSVRDVVTRRVDRLGDDVTQVLTLASVIGREFDLEVLAALADLDVDTTLDHLEAAVAAGLVAERPDVVGRFRFEHALIQHTLYQDLSATRRQRVHHRVAQALEELTGERAAPVTELAHHWLAATRPSDVGKALEYARLAGEGALTALAPDDAIRWFSQALELQERQAPDDLTARCDLLIGLGDAQRQAGDAAYRTPLLEAADLADRLGDGPRLGAAALATGRGTQTLDDDAELVALVERALARVDDGSALEARLLAASANAMDPREWRTSRAIAQRAVDLARDLDDDALRLAVLNATSVCRSQPDELERRLADAREAVVLADRIGTRIDAFSARFEHHQAVMESGAVQDADAILDDLLERSRDLGLPYPMWQALLNRGARELRLGDAEAAEATAEEALALATRAGIVEGMGAYGGQLFNIRAHQGRLGELAELFLAAAEENASIDALRAAVIAVCLATGDVDEARRRYVEEREGGFDFTFQYSWFQCIGELSDAAVELDDHAGAVTLYDRLVPYAGRLSFVHAVPPRPMARPLARLATVLGRHDDADHHFATALDLCERLRAPYWQARTLLDHAEAIEARGTDAHRAREMATTVSALALEHGCAVLSARAASLLARVPAA